MQFINPPGVVERPLAPPLFVEHRDDGWPPLVMTRADGDPPDAPAFIDAEVSNHPGLSVRLLSDRQPFGVLFWAYNLTLVMALLGVAGLSKSRLVKAFTYGYFINLALLVGYGRYALGLQRVTWRRAKR